MSEYSVSLSSIFFFQGEDGIRVTSVTGVQTCALPILMDTARDSPSRSSSAVANRASGRDASARRTKIGRASCRERGYTTADPYGVKKRKTKVTSIMG